MATLTVAAIGMTILLALLPETGHDQQWLLLAAQRMHGLNPYGPTVFESNPPLAIWLSAIVVALAKPLHLSLTVTFKFVVTFVAAAIACLCARLLQNSRHSDPECNAGEEPLYFARTPTQLWLLAIAFLLIFGAVPARDFGQRDHILTLLILPYLISAARPTRALFPRTLITLLAALGLALKPHQALIPIAVELTLLIRPTSLPHSSRSHRAEWVLRHKFRLLEPALFLLAALTYFLAIRRFAPTYLTQILPLLRDTYWAFGHLTLPQLALSAIELLTLAALTITLYLRTSPRDPLITILLAAASAAAIGYLLQGTGWYYQQLPAISLFALALVLTLTFQLKTLNSTTIRLLPSAMTILTILALTLTTWFSDFHVTPRGRFPKNLQQPQPVPDPTFFANLPPGTAVATLTTSVDDTVPPAFRYHLVLAQRYPHLWMLPAILRNESGPKPTHPIASAQLAYLDRLQHQFMVEDLTRWHPVLILVARCQDPTVHCQVLEDRHDNLLAWFLRDPAFSAIFAHYRFQRTSGPYDAYTLAP